MKTKKNKNKRLHLSSFEDRIFKPCETNYLKGLNKYQWYKRYLLYNEAMQKEAGMKENILSGLLGALILVISGASIPEAASKTLVSETEIVKALQNEDMVNQARQARQSLTEVDESAQNILARTIYAETKGEPIDAKKAVATVIFNRGRGTPEGMLRAVQTPKQFSCWNKATAEDWTNMKQGLGQDWEDSMKIAKSLLEGTFYPVGSFDHYFNPEIVRFPTWAHNQPSKQIGQHLFFTLKSWKS